jgi:hypothetical protein
MKSVLQTSILGMLFAAVGAYGFGVVLFLVPVFLDASQADPDWSVLNFVFGVAFLPF